MLRCAALTLLLALAPAPQPLAGPDLEGLEERVESLEEARRVLFLLAGGTLLAVALRSWHLLKKADVLAERRLAKVVESRPKALRQLIEEHDIETRLRRESRVAVVSESLRIEGVLSQHGFRRVATVPPGAATSAALEPYAAVILDLEGGVSEQAAAALVAQGARESFLAYVNRHVTLPRDRATFANSAITLYARLMELLRFLAAQEAN
jgi:hypothetical protein